MLSTDLESNNPTITKEHNHQPDENQIGLAKLKTQMKTHAKNSRDKPGQIYAQAISNVSNEIHVLLSCANFCKCTFKNQRPIPSVPCQLEDLGELLETFTITLGDNPEPFMLYNNGPNRNDCILMFGTLEGLKCLASSEMLYMDGSVAMAPNGFTQLYVIRVPFDESAIT